MNTITPVGRSDDDEIGRRLRRIRHVAAIAAALIRIAVDIGRVVAEWRGW